MTRKLGIVAEQVRMHDTGLPLSGIMVSVFKTGTTDYAKLCRVAVKRQKTMNPLVTDQDGIAMALVRPGIYDIRVAGNGIYPTELKQVRVRTLSVEQLLNLLGCGKHR